MAENDNVKMERSIFREIFFHLKENIILILIIVVMFTAGGVVYAKLQKPIYTANEKINYVAKYENDKEDVGKSINIMRAYVDTMKDFCTTGVVLDRAEYYYNMYLTSGIQIDAFIDLLKTGAYDAGYNPSNVQRTHYNAKAVSCNVVQAKDSTEDSFMFQLTYKNTNPTVAQEMIRVFAVAIDVEGEDYFEGVETHVYELVKSTQDIVVTNDTSNMKLIIVFALIGVIVSVFIVYLKTLLDNTIKDKEELEELTGVSVIAYIDKQENYNG